MQTFKDFNKAIWFSLGWFLVFVILQTVYMVFAVVFKAITDVEYLLAVQQLFNSASEQGSDELMNVYIEVIGSVTSYIEVFLTIGMSGLLVIDREIHGNRYAFNKIKITEIPLFISLGILMNILSTLFISLFSTETLTETGYDTTMMLQGGFLGVLIGVGICAPLCEEITFRYFIYHNSNRLNQIFALIFSAALFGLAHGNILQGMYAFTFGLIFVIMNNKYNSIWPGTIMHMSVNSLSVFLMLANDSAVQIALMIGAFVISLIPTSVILISKLVKHEEIF